MAVTASIATEHGLVSRICPVAPASNIWFLGLLTPVNTPSQSVRQFCQIYGRDQHATTLQINVCTKSPHLFTSCMWYMLKNKTIGTIQHITCLSEHDDVLPTSLEDDSATVVNNGWATDEFHQRLSDDDDGVCGDVDDVLVVVVVGDGVTGSAVFVVIVVVVVDVVVGRIVVVVVVVVVDVVVGCITVTQKCQNK